MGWASSTLPLEDRFRFERSLRLLELSGANIRAGSTWLDLGCNRGQFLNLLCDRYEVKATGFDDWDPALHTCKDRWSYQQVDLDRVLPDTEPASFISAFEVLEHMVDTDGFLARAYDRLVPGGRLIISTPNINCLRNRIWVPLGKYPAMMEYRNIIHHVRLYNVATLTSHLSQIGYEIVDQRGVSFLPQARGLFTSRVSVALADCFPALCSNIIVIARKPSGSGRACRD